MNELLDLAVVIAVLGVSTGYVALHYLRGRGQICSASPSCAECHPGSHSAAAQLVQLGRPTHNGRR